MDRYGRRPKPLQEIILERLDKNSALIFAVCKSNVEYVQRYINKGADVNTPGHITNTYYFDNALSRGIGMVKAFADAIYLFKAQLTGGNTLIHFASKLGSSEIVEALIKEGANLKARDSEGYTALHVASSTENSDVVKILIKAGSDLNAQDNIGSTALQIASTCTDESIDIIDALIKAGADLHIRDVTGRTAIHLAAEFECTEILEILIKAWSNVNAQDNRGKTALHYASQTINARNITILTAAGANVNVQDSCGNTALHFVLPELEIPYYYIIKSIHRSPYTYNEDLSEHLINVSRIVNLLIEKGIDLNKQDKDGNTALHLAMLLPDNIALVKTLISAGADVNKQNANEETALHFTHLWKIGNIVRLLKEAGINVNKQNRWGNTALHVPSASTATEIVQELILADIDVNKQNVHGNTALHFNIMGGCNYKILEILIKNGAHLSSKNVNGLEPLQYAIHRNAFLNVFKLHDNFKFYRDVYGNTIFHLFIENCHLKSEEKIWTYIRDQQVIFVEYLRIQNMFGETPLHIAASREDGEEEALDIILSSFDACPLDFYNFLLDRNGNTFFHTFLSFIKRSQNVKRDVSFIKRLLGGEYRCCPKHDIEKLVHFKNKTGHTPLHIFVNKTNEIGSGFNLINVFELFLKAGANINSRNTLSETPVHSLIYFFWRQQEAIDIALKNGADVNVQNIVGESPIFNLYNRWWPYPVYDSICLELLTKYGARTDLCNKLGQTPIIVHMIELREMFNANVIQMFEKKGVDVNQQDKNKNNLLHYIAWETELEKAANIYGLDIFKWSDFSLVPDSLGQLPCDVAYLLGHNNLLNELCVCKNGVHKEELVFCSRKILFESLKQKDDKFQEFVQTKCKYFSESTIQHIMDVPFLGLVNCDGEAEAVKEAVVSIVKVIGRRIQDNDELLSNTVILSGSVAENTKVGLPDEFDFIILLQKLSNFIDIEEYDDNTYVRVKLKEEFRGNPCRSFFDRNCYLDQRRIIDRFHFLLQQITQMPDIYTHSNIFPIKEGLKRPAKSPNFKLSLRWSGCKYKNMIINIDLVPSCQIRCSSSKFLSQTVSSKTHGNEEVLVLFQEAHTCKKRQGRMSEYIYNEGLVRVSQANAEKTILATLPQNAIDAYVVSKILCNDRICPTVIDGKQGSFRPTLSSIISSYILKNCLLHVADKMPIEASSTVSIHNYVCRIFQKLLQCAHSKTLPCYMFPGQNLFTFPTFSDDKENHNTCVSRAIYAKLILNILGKKEDFCDFTPTTNVIPDNFPHLYGTNPLDIVMYFINDYLCQSDPIRDNNICANCKKNPDEYGITLEACSRCKLWTYCSAECKKANWNRHRLACDYHYNKACHHGVIPSKRSIASHQSTQNDQKLIIRFEKKNYSPICIVTRKLGDLKITK